MVIFLVEGVSWFTCGPIVVSLRALLSVCVVAPPPDVSTDIDVLLWAGVLHSYLVLCTRLTSTISVRNFSLWIIFHHEVAKVPVVCVLIHSCVRKVLHVGIDVNVEESIIGLHAR